MIQPVHAVILRTCNEMIRERRMYGDRVKLFQAKARLFRSRMVVPPVGRVVYTSIAGQITICFRHPAPLNIVLVGMYILPGTYQVGYPRPAGAAIGGL